MIAPTGCGCKGAAAKASRFARGRRPARAETDRHGIVSGNHNTAPLPPSARPAGLRNNNPALARSFRCRIPQPPAPRGRRDRACSQDSLYPLLGQRELVLFVLGDRCWRGASAPIDDAAVIPGAQAQDAKVAKVAIMVNDLRSSPYSRDRMTTAEFSEASCRPRRASDRACRDCRPGHTPPRRRRPRVKYFPAAPSSWRDCRSSRRL